MSSLRNYTTVLLIHHRFFIFAVAYMILSPFFSVASDWVAMRFYSNFITLLTKRFWQDLKRLSYTWVSFIVVIAIAIVVDTLLYVYKSIFRTSIKCRWYVWVVLLIETCIFWTNYVTVSLTLDVIFSLLRLWFIFEMCSLRSYPRPILTTCEHHRKYCQQIDTKNITRSLTTFEL